MVLEDLDSPQDNFSNNPDPSDNDAFAKRPDGLFFDPQKLNYPPPIPLLGLGRNSVTNRAQKAIETFTQHANRPPTPTEGQAIAGHLIGMDRARAGQAYLSASAGIYRWWVTMDKGRYPFYQPTDVNPNKFWLIEGPWANYARHSFRFALYTIVATQVGDAVTRTIFSGVTTRKIIEDPALKDLMKGLREKLEAQRGSAGHGENPVQRRMRESAEAHKQANARSSGAPSSESSNSSWDDDGMSPTAGNESWSTSTNGPWNDSAYSSNSTPDSRSSQASASQPPPAWGTSQPPQQQSYDDSSPTGGLFQTETENNSSNTSGPAEQQGGSAWERLRRGGAPSAPTQRPPPPRRSPYVAQREASTVGDSFTFAGSDEERQRAQEQAQREFDERLERERQGKDFSDNERKW